MKFLILLVGLSLSSALELEVTKVVSLAAPLVNETEVLPEITSNSGQGRSLLGNLYQATVPFVVRKLGLVECAGLDHTFGGDFFERIMGKGADFGGNYLCQPTCGGECVPTQGLGEAPISIYYPFGCRCAPQRCDANGPIVTPLIKPLFKVVCVPDERCTCASMAPRGQLKGYLCNWINLESNLPVSFFEQPLLSGYAPEKSPIRWCSCCPASRLY